MNDFNDAMLFCAQHGVLLNIIQMDEDHYMLAATLGVISSEALFTTPDTVLEAFHMVTSSVMAGFNFHSEHGLVPKR